ncbi:MAG: SDR family oxidoreductase [Planctomycetes bacterium]|nr:SDR family oxidoreductase [Planctomycetota bacterium]
MKLNGKVAIVTGASSGIGKAIALLFSKEGAKIAICGRSKERLDETSRNLKESHLSLTCDVTKEAEVNAFVDKVEERFGRIDILVNNAGDPTSMPISKMTLDFWNRIISANLTSVFLCTSACLPVMMRQRYGHIVNVASIVGKMGGKYISAYSAGKHGVLGFTRSVAIEVKDYGITINAVCPGFVDTPATDRNIENITQKTGMSPEEIRKFMAKENQSGKIITSEEVAMEVLNLAADETGKKNGEAIDLW